MTTHLLQPMTPAVAPRFRCGVLISKSERGDRLGSDCGLPHITCAACLRSLIVEMRLKELGEDVENPSPELLWLVGGDTGTSSITIWWVMVDSQLRRRTLSRLAMHHRNGVPHDVADFARCHFLLRLFPAWRARMPEVAAAHPAWAGLVTEWDALTALYIEGKAPKLYERLEALTA